MHLFFRKLQIKRIEKKKKEYHSTSRRSSTENANEKWNFERNICTKGKEFTEEQNREYLLEFAKGPCTPLVLVPGIGGTKLMVQIECNEFLHNHQIVFEQCGFTHCHKKSWEVLSFLIILFVFID